MEVLNGYIAFYAGKRFEVYATSLLAAKEKALAHFKVPKSKLGLMGVVLAEKAGQPRSARGDGRWQLAP